MNQADFKKQVDKLSIAFHKKPLLEWENLLFDKCKYWKTFRLENTVDKLIETCEKFPSIAEIMEVSWEFNRKEETKLKTYDCDHCATSGHFLATINGDRCLFRCHTCINWKNKFSESIPQWGQIWEDKGYIPEFKKIYTKESTGPNKELAADSLEFVTMMFSWRGTREEKSIFEISWADTMAKKYPHLAYEYRKQAERAKMVLNQLSGEKACDGMVQEK